MLIANLDVQTRSAKTRLTTRISTEIVMASEDICGEVSTQQISGYFNFIFCTMNSCGTYTKHNSIDITAVMNQARLTGSIKYISLFLHIIG